MSVIELIKRLEYYHRDIESLKNKQIKFIIDNKMIPSYKYLDSGSDGFNFIIKITRDDKNSK